MTLLEEKMALKELVDTFSNLADIKNTAAQALLFDENAVLKSYISGDMIAEQIGRKAIEQACASFLALFDTVYHMNGQQVVEIKENTAVGTAYCQVVLIGMQDGKRVMTTQGVIYNDEYIKKDGKWLIANRNSNFIWQDNKIVG